MLLTVDSLGFRSAFADRHLSSPGDIIPIPSGEILEKDIIIVLLEML